MHMKHLYGQVTMLLYLPLTSGPSIELS